MAETKQTPGPDEPDEIDLCYARIEILTHKLEAIATIIDRKATVPLQAHIDRLEAEVEELKAENAKLLEIATERG